MLSGFDPVSDQMDRRVLFEVTGIRLYKDEFKDQESSSSANSDDENDWGTKEQLLDIDYAMMGDYPDIAIQDSSANTNIQSQQAPISP